MSDGERARLRAEGEQYGVRAGIMCPPCVARALDDPENFALGMSLGEVLVQAIQGKAPWRIVLAPNPDLLPEPEPLQMQAKGVSPLEVLR